MTHLFASRRNLAIAALLAASAALGVMWQLSAASLETTVAERDAARQRVANLAEQVKASRQAVAEAAAVNGRQAEAIERHRRNLADARRALHAAEQEARRRDAAVLRAARAAREADRQRRADPNLPPPDVMNAALSAAASGL